MLTETSFDQQEHSAIDSVPTGLFIGGRWRSTAEALAVLDPVTGQPLCRVADAGPDEGIEAIAAAAAAQSDWGRTTARERSDLLMRAHRALLDDTERLALIMTLEMG